MFGLEDGAKLYPLRLCADPQAGINLLLFQEGENTHWVWIKDFNGLCHDLNRCRTRNHFCLRCLSPHRTAENLQKHMERCKDFQACAIEMPDPDKPLRFRNYRHRMKAPYVRNCSEVWCTHDYSASLSIIQYSSSVMFTQSGMIFMRVSQGWLVLYLLAILQRVCCELSE